MMSVIAIFQQLHSESKGQKLAGLEHNRMFENSPTYRAIHSSPFTLNSAASFQGSTGC